MHTPRPTTTTAILLLAILAAASLAEAADSRYPSTILLSPGDSVVAVGTDASTCRRFVSVRTTAPGGDPENAYTGNFTAGPDAPPFWVHVKTRQAGTCTTDRVDVGIALVSEDGVTMDSVIRLTLSNSVYAQVHLGSMPANHGTSWINVSAPGHAALCTTSACVSYQNAEGGTSSKTWTLASGNDYNHGAAEERLRWPGTYTLVVTGVWRDNLNNEVATGRSGACHADGCSNTLGQTTQGFIRGLLPAPPTVEVLDASCSDPDTKFMPGERVCVNVNDIQPWRFDSHWNTTRSGVYTYTGTRFDQGVEGADCHSTLDLCLLVGRDRVSTGTSVVWGIFTTRAGEAVGSEFQISGNMEGSCSASPHPLDAVFVPPSGRWIVGAACASNPGNNVFLVDTSGTVVASATTTSTGTVPVRPAWTTTSAGTLYYAAATIASNAASARVFDANLAPQGNAVSLCATACGARVFITGVPGTGAFYATHREGASVNWDVYVSRVDAGSSPTRAWKTSIHNSAEGQNVNSIAATSQGVVSLHTRTASSNHHLGLLRTDGSVVENIDTGVSTAATAYLAMDRDTLWFTHRTGSGSGTIRTVGYALEPNAGQPRQVSAISDLSATGTVDEIRITGSTAVISQHSTTDRVAHFYSVRPSQELDIKVTPSTGPVYGGTARSGKSAVFLIPVSTVTKGHAGAVHAVQETHFYGLPWTSLAGGGNTVGNFPTVTIPNPDGADYDVAGYGVERGLSVTVDDVRLPGVGSAGYFTVAESVEADVSISDRWGDALRSGLEVGITPRTPTNGDITAMKRTATIGVAGAAAYASTAIPATGGAGSPEDTYASPDHSVAEEKDVTFRVVFPSDEPTGAGDGESAGAFDIDDDLYGSIFRARTADAVVEADTYGIGLHDIYSRSTWLNVRGEAVESATVDCDYTRPNAVLGDSWTFTTDAAGTTDTRLTSPGITPGIATISCNAAKSGASGATQENVELLANIIQDPIRIRAPGIVLLNEATSISVQASWLDASARTGAAADLFIYIRDPNGVVVVDGANPIEIADGGYRYTFTPTTRGVYDARAVTVLDGQTISDITVFFAGSADQDVVDLIEKVRGELSAGQAGQNATSTTQHAEVVDHVNRVLAGLAGQNATMTTRHQEVLDIFTAFRAEVQDDFNAAEASAATRQTAVFAYLDLFRDAVAAAHSGQNATASTRHSQILALLDDIDAAIASGFNSQGASLASLHAKADALSSAVAAFQAETRTAHSGQNATAAADHEALHTALDEGVAELRALLENDTSDATVLSDIALSVTRLREHLNAHDLATAEGQAQVHADFDAHRAGSEPSRWWNESLGDFGRRIQDPEERAQMLHASKVQAKRLLPRTPAQDVLGLLTLGFAGVTLYQYRQARLTRQERFLNEDGEVLVGRAREEANEERLDSRGRRLYPMNYRWAAVTALLLLSYLFTHHYGV